MTMLRQAYSPPTKYDAFFPNASHWAELSRPFRAFTAISLQPANNSTNKHFNNSTTQHPKSIEGLKARIISAPSRKGGVSMSALYSEG